MSTPRKQSTSSKWMHVSNTFRQMIKLHGKQLQEMAERGRLENPISSRPILIYFEFRGKPSLITVICVDPHSHNKILFLHTRRWYSFFFFIYLSFVFMICYAILFSLLLLIFTKIIMIFFIIIILFIDFSHKNYVNFSWTGMFRKIPECSVFLVLSTPEQSGPQPDLDIWWRHPHLQNGAHAEKHEGRSVPGSLLCLEVSFPHTTLRAVTLDNEKSGVWRKNAVRWTFVRSWEVKRPNTRVFQLKEMSDKEQNIEKKKVSVIFWTVGKNFFEIYIKFACW